MSVPAESGCRGLRGLTSGGTAPPAERPGSRLAEGLLPVFSRPVPTKRVDRWVPGPFTLWPVGEERVALASPLPLVRLFYFSSVSHLVAAPPTQKRLSGMVAPPPSDPLPHPASSDSGSQVRLRTRTPGLRGPVGGWEALLSRGAGRGVTDEEGPERTDPSQNRPLLRVSAPSLLQSPSQQDPPGLRGRAMRLRRARGGTPRRPPSATSGKAPSPASPGPGVRPGTPPSQCPWHPSVVTHRPRPERLREPGVGSARGGKVTGRVTCGVASGRTN